MYKVKIDKKLWLCYNICDSFAKFNKSEAKRS